MIDEQRLLTADEVAEIIGVSARMVRLYPARDLHYFQNGKGGKRRYDPRDVADFIERRKVRR